MMRSIFESGFVRIHHWIFLIIVVLSPVLAIGGFFLILAGGPKVFFPNQYSLKMTVRMTVDGRPMSHVGGVRCLVKDQRGGIAAPQWRTDDEYGQPFFIRANGGAVILSQINPCIWRETKPKAGVVYDLDLLGESYVAGAEWGEIPFFGEVNMLDDAANPKSLLSILVSQAIGQTFWGVRIDGVQLEVSDAPVDTRLLEFVPAVAEKISFTAIQVVVDKNRDIAKCAGSTDGEWAALPATASCGSSRDQFLLPTVSQDHGRINVTSTDSTVSKVSILNNPEFGIATKVLRASKQGVFSPDDKGGELFTWLPEFCVDGQCFATARGDNGGPAVVVVNSSRNIMLLLRSSSISIGNWIDD